MARKTSIRAPHPSFWRKLLGSDSGKLALLFLTTFAFALFVAGETLNYPWYWDDYHLIRSFSGDELRRALRGAWDADGIETVSYRPLWVLTNHLRALAFGENLIAHRLLLVGSLALFTSLIALCAHREGLKLPYAIGASLVAVTAKANHPNLMWLTDATHALSGIPVALCCVMRSRPSERPKTEAAAILFLSLVTLFIREDGAALFPLVVLVGTVRRRAESESAAPDYRRVRNAVLSLSLSLLVYFALRRLFVPGATTTLQPDGWSSHVSMTLALLGTRVSEAWLVGWYALVAAMLLGGFAAIATGRSTLRWVPLVWLACAVLACTPGLAQVRSNLLMVPVTLFVCTLAMVLQSAGTLARSWRLSAVLIAVVAPFTWCSVQQTQQALLSGHPQSTQTVKYTADFLYGRFAKKATIPPERREYAAHVLAVAGIVSSNSYASGFPRLVLKARRQPRAPHQDGSLFVPPNPFLMH